MAEDETISGFLVGAVWAAAEMVRLGEESYAEHLCSAAGITKSSLAKPESRGGFADYDREVLLAAAKKGRWFTR